MHCQGTDLTKANTGKTYKASSLATSQRFLHAKKNYIILYVHHNISHHIHREIVLICALLYADTAISKVLIIN